MTRHGGGAPICYCGECGRLLRPSGRGHVVTYRRKIMRRIAVMALTWMAAGLTMGAAVTLVALRMTGAWKP